MSVKQQDLDDGDWGTIRIALARAIVDLGKQIKRAKTVHNKNPNSRSPRPSELAMEAGGFTMTYEKVKAAHPTKGETP